MTFDIYALRLDGPYSTSYYYRGCQKRRSIYEKYWVDDIKLATIWTNKAHAKSALSVLIKRKAVPPNELSRLHICRFTANYKDED